MSKSRKKQEKSKTLTHKGFKDISDKFQKIFNDLKTTPKDLATKKRILQNRQAFHDLYLSDKNDINARDEFGNTLLHYAVNIGTEEAIRMLIDRGADVNLANNNKQTPLHFAAIENKPQVAQILIENNADIDAKTTQGYTPLDLADTASVTQRVLRSKSAEVSKKNNDQKIDDSKLPKTEKASKSESKPRKVSAKPKSSKKHKQDQLKQESTKVTAPVQAMNSEEKVVVAPEPQPSTENHAPDAVGAAPKIVADVGIEKTATVKGSEVPEKLNENAAKNSLPQPVSQQQYALFATNIPGYFLQLPVITPAEYRRNLNSQMDQFLAAEKNKFFATHMQKNGKIQKFEDIPEKDRRQFDIYEKGQVARKENLLQQNFLQEELITTSNVERRNFLQQKLGELQKIQLERDGIYEGARSRAAQGKPPYDLNDRGENSQMSDLQNKQNPLIFEGHIDTTQGLVKQTKLNEAMRAELQAMAGNNAKVQASEGAVNAQVIFGNLEDARKFLEKLGAAHDVKGRNQEGKHVYPNADKKFTVFITPGEVQKIEKSMASGGVAKEREKEVEVAKVTEATLSEPKPAPAVVEAKPQVDVAALAKLKVDKPQSKVLTPTAPNDVAPMPDAAIQIASPIPEAEAKQQAAVTPDGIPIPPPPMLDIQVPPIPDLELDNNKVLDAPNAVQPKSSPQIVEQQPWYKRLVGAIKNAFGGGKGEGSSVKNDKPDNVAIADSSQNNLPKQSNKPNVEHMKGVLVPPGENPPLRNTVAPSPAPKAQGQEVTQGQGGGIGV